MGSCCGVSKKLSPSISKSQVPPPQPLAFHSHPLDQQEQQNPKSQLQLQQHTDKNQLASVPYKSPVNSNAINIIQFQSSNQTDSVIDTIHANTSNTHKDKQAQQPTANQLQQQSTTTSNQKINNNINQGNNGSSGIKGQQLNSQQQQQHQNHPSSQALNEQIEQFEEEYSGHAILGQHQQHYLKQQPQTIQSQTYQSVQKQQDGSETNRGSLPLQSAQHRMTSTGLVIDSGKQSTFTSPLHGMKSTSDEFQLVAATTNTASVTELLEKQRALSSRTVSYSYRENYQNLTNQILARNDIFIFSSNSTTANQQQQLNQSIYTFEGIPSSSTSKPPTHSNIQTNNSANATKKKGPKERASSIIAQSQTWSKILDKHSSSALQKGADQSNSNSQGHPFQEVFSQILKLGERAWYSEASAVFKERNQQTSRNMQETLFQKRQISLHNHFTWFIHAIVHAVFNHSPATSTQLCEEYSIQPLNNNSTNNNRGNNLENNPSENVKLDTIDLPGNNSEQWLQGFVYKGVFLRAIPRSQSKPFKAEMRALKHLAVEYFQTESSIKLVLENGSDPIGNVNFMLPLLSAVETLTFLVYGTPVISLNESNNQLIQKHRFSLLSGIQSTSQLLKNLKDGNLNAIDDNLIIEGSNQSIPEIAVVITNAKDLTIKHREYNVAFVISENSEKDIAIFDPPAQGYIEIKEMKERMGYGQLEECKYHSLNYNYAKMQSEIHLAVTQSSYSLDYVQFTKQGWAFKMIYLSQFDPHKASLNHRATSFLDSATDKTRELKNVSGNVLVFAKLLNKTTQILPQLGNNSSSIINDLKQPKSFFSLDLDEEKEMELCLHLQEQLSDLQRILDTTDSIISNRSLNNMVHSKGVNLRYLFVLFIMCTTRKAKALIACDILSRVLKSIAVEKLPITTRSNNVQLLKLQEQMKSLLCKYLNPILIGPTKSADAVAQDATKFLEELCVWMHLSRLRIAHHAKLILSEKDFDRFFSTGILTEIIGFAHSNASLLLSSVSVQCKMRISNDIIQPLKNDNFYLMLKSTELQPAQFSYSRFEVSQYLTIKEAGYLTLIRISSEQNSTQFHEAVSPLLRVPPCLYKNPSIKETLLKSKYEVLNEEVLRDCYSYLQLIFGNVLSHNSDQHFFEELSILEFFHSVFIQRSDKNRLNALVNERILPFLQNSAVFSAELVISLYTCLGILQEQTNQIECEESYTIAMLAIHKVYGDPRGRGSRVIPFELFITWRLSIIARLQGKYHDAEYIEEIYDCILFGLQLNEHNSYAFKSSIYSNPFSHATPIPAAATAAPTGVTAFNGQSIDSKKTNSNSQQLPFPHWTQYANIDESESVFALLSESLLQNSKNLYVWLVENLLIFQESKVLWRCESFNSFMRSLFQNTSLRDYVTASSLASTKKENDPNLHLTQHQSSHGTRNLKNENLMTRQTTTATSNQSGSIVQILESDSSTFSKKRALGVVFSWGQNTQGQMGTVFDVKQLPNSKKIRINYPKLVFPLKDTIITSVACGYQHSIAVTFSGALLAWGDNTHSQLGLGRTYPQFVPYPVPINYLANKTMIQIACGSEHSIALDSNRIVYSWGNGEGGLLGHGDENVQYDPKPILAFSSMKIDYITCGGLHSLVLTSDSKVYSWGRNEGCQLGIDQKYFSTEACFSTVPIQVLGSIANVRIVQIAAGEAHSIVLAENGDVHGWGYNMNGQLGLGTKYSQLPIIEPMKIPKLPKIEKIYAGQTFSMFVNENKQVLTCGLNDQNQLGIEREPIKIASVTTALDQLKPKEIKRMNMDVFNPKKMECFHQIPVLHMSCGHNHSLALVLVDAKHYMLFAWGMNKHAQLGIGETNSTSSMPRPITFLQDVMIPSIACGSYHSLALANDSERAVNKAAVAAQRTFFERFEPKWRVSVRKITTDLPSYRFDSIAPSEEGKIDNPQFISKMNQFNTSNASHF